MQFDRCRGDLFAKGSIVFGEDHRRLKGIDQLFELYAGINVCKIEGFIPDIQMRSLAKALCKQYFFLLSL